MSKLQTRALAAAALALTAVSAHAQSAAPKSGAYSIEPHHTMLLFSLNHMGFTTYFGQFSDASGTLKLDVANPAASQVDISVPVASVMTSTPVLNTELKSPQFFDAATYPTMTFHSTKIVSTGPTTADVTGDLTMHGVTKPVTLKATLHGGGANPMTKKTVVGFDASGQIKRSDFGVKYGVPMVGDDVTLMLSAEFDQTS